MANKSNTQQRKATSMPTEKQKLTPPEIARLWGITPDKVLRWIYAGELRAIDASTKQGGRPRYLVDREDLATFERKRSTAPAPAKPAPRRRPPVKSYV